MVFSSLVFICIFLPALLAAYYAAPGRHRNAVALAASCLFYAWGAPLFIFVLIGSSAVDYVLGNLIHATPRERLRRRHVLLGAAVAFNVAVLLYFKYANFFVDQANQLLGLAGVRAISWTSVALPIGISFFTFQKISYLVDVYRGTARRALSFPTYLLYVSLFPQLIAGPIVRYHDVATQLESRAYDPGHVFSGIWRFSRGLAKKVLLANVLGAVADRAFGMPAQELPAAQAWIGVFCYSFQIYFDFSGYSDMAIGLGRLLGIEFLENFNLPYIARNFTEFWRRWHISLSNWMREYIYIPLGGNRRGGLRTYVNLWAVFLVSGLWHGAAWNFVVWGAYHGLFISLDKLFKRTRLARAPRLIAIPVTFLLVQFSWVLFRADSLGHALAYLQRMFAFGPAGQTAALSTAGLIDAHAWFILLVSCVLSFAPAFRRHEPAPGIIPVFRPAAAAWTFAASVALLFLSMASLATGGFNPFIYFRF